MRAKKEADIKMQELEPLLGDKVKTIEEITVDQNFEPKLEFVIRSRFDEGTLYSTIRERSFLDIRGLKGGINKVTKAITYMNWGIDTDDTLFQVTPDGYYKISQMLKVKGIAHIVSVQTDWDIDNNLRWYVERFGYTLNDKGRIEKGFRMLVSETGKIKKV